jgi:hypothetical protein
LSFSPHLTNSTVLQRQPAKAAIYGFVDPAAKAPSIEVTITAGSETATNDRQRTQYTVNATVDGKGGWKAYLQPTAAGGNYEISAVCLSGCVGNETIFDVTFGDVWFW